MADGQRESFDEEPIPIHVELQSLQITSATEQLEETPGLGVHQYMVDKLTDICEEGDGLDIYQYCAYMSFVKRMNVQRVNEVCHNASLRKDYGTSKTKHDEFMKLRRETRALKKSYQYSVLKALICSTLQIGAAVTVILHERRDIREGKGWCASKEEQHRGLLKAMVILFAAYMCLEFSSLFVEIQEGGVYEGKLFFDRYTATAKKSEEVEDDDNVKDEGDEVVISGHKLKSAMGGELKLASGSEEEMAIVGAHDFDEEYEGWFSPCVSVSKWFVVRRTEKGKAEAMRLVPIPPFVDTRWVVFGRNVNYATAALSLFASQIVLYNSDTALDAILNSVAMLFLIGLDDDSITATGYLQSLFAGLSPTPGRN